MSRRLTHTNPGTEAHSNKRGDLLRTTSSLMADAQRTPEPGIFTHSCFNSPRHETSHYFLLSARSLGDIFTPVQFSSLALVGLLRQPCCALGFPIGPGWAQLPGLPHRPLCKERPSASSRTPLVEFTAIPYRPTAATDRKAAVRHSPARSSALGGTQDHNAAPHRRASLLPAPPHHGPVHLSHPVTEPRSPPTPRPQTALLSLPSLGTPPTRHALTRPAPVPSDAGGARSPARPARRAARTTVRTERGDP